MLECETLSTVVVNVTHTWLLPNGTSTSRTFQDTTCGAGDCESFIDIPTVDFQHQGNYTCQTDFGEIIAFLEVESCKLKRIQSIIIIIKVEPNIFYVIHKLVIQFRHKINEST